MVFDIQIFKMGMILMSATAAVGMITEARQAEEIISAGRADLVLLGRELLRNPCFPLHAAREMKTEIEWPLQYLRAK